MIASSNIVNANPYSQGCGHTLYRQNFSTSTVSVLNTSVLSTNSTSTVRREVQLYDMSLVQYVHIIIVRQFFQNDVIKQILSNINIEHIFFDQKVKNVTSISFYHDDQRRPFISSRFFLLLNKIWCKF